MNINTNMSALMTQRQAGLAQRQLLGGMEKISSTKQINRAGDNPSGMAIVEKLVSQVRGLERASQNAREGVDMIRTADGVLSSAHESLGRMRELAVQASSDIYTDEQRAMMQQEYQGMMNELNDISTQAKFNDKRLFATAVAGSDVSFAPADTTLQVGPSQGDTVSLNINEMVSGSLGISGTDLSSQASASTALDRLDSAINTVSTQRGNLGAVQNRLESKIESLDIGAENQLAGQSRIGDNDVAKQMIKLMSDRMRSNFATALLAQGNMNNRSALQLLM